LKKSIRNPVKRRNLCPYFQSWISPAPDKIRRFEDAPGRRLAAKLLTEDEARRIADNAAKLPDLFAAPIQLGNLVKISE
jgi:hypothetical protein